MLLFLPFAAITLLVVFYIYQLSFWKRRGIPGPPGIPFSGHFWTIGERKYPGVLKLRDWTKQYGKVYGILEGYRKVLIVSDVNMLQELFVKKFDIFYGRKGNRWKRLRTICAPTFSSGSLKKISATVEDSALELVRLLEDVSETEPVNIYTYFQEYTMDVISRIAMGQQGSNMFHNPLTPFTRKIFGFNMRSPIILLAAVFPIFRICIRKFFIGMAKLRRSPVLPIFDTCYKTVDDRIAQRADAKEGIEPGEARDFVDLFLDARAEDTLHDSSDFSRNNMKVARSLTREEIVAQCFLFLLAGFDTTSNALAFTSWLLATHPGKQRKLLEEIDEHCSASESVSYETLSKLKYMEAVIKETLRMFPLAALAASRQCMADTPLGDYEIEKGTLIWADVWSVQYDKELWGEDADEFVPERWLRDEIRHSMAWLPFGAGPRLCIGQRLAYIEEKLALVYILRQFVLEKGAKTEKVLKLSGATTVQPEAVTVYLKRR